MKTRCYFKSGFTLIELLIVVAIIAILAAIAVPNFLEAQTRSKISRVHADLRSLATAIEAYTIDNNKPPVDYNTGSGGDPKPPNVTTPGNISGIPHPGRADSTAPGGVRAGLTTPVSYILNCWIKDPFISPTETFADIAFDEQVYTYNWFRPTNAVYMGRTPLSTYVNNKYMDFYGAYRVGSIGPDRSWYSGLSSTIGGSRVYDPTNGTISKGNIWRSQADSQVKSRPKADIASDPQG